MANRQFARATRRKTQWGGFGDAVGASNLPAWQTLTAGVSVILSQSIIAGGGAGIIDEETTITRTIGALGFAADVTTAEASGSVAFGCAVVRGEAAAAGVGSLPSLHDDPDFEWLYYGVFPFSNPQNALQDGPISGGMVQFDVRGQRILRSGQNVIWLAEATTVNARGYVGGRYLVKLT